MLIAPLVRRDSYDVRDDTTPGGSPRRVAVGGRSGGSIQSTLWVALVILTCHYTYMAHTHPHKESRMARFIINYLRHVRWVLGTRSWWALVQDEEL